MVHWQKKMKNKSHAVEIEDKGQTFTETYNAA